MEKSAHERGSFTVEASLIIPVVILAVLALMFTFSYMQQKACITSAAAYAAQQGAELWLDSRKDMDSGMAGMYMKEDPLGYRVFDNLLMSSKVYEGYIVREKTSRGKMAYVLRMTADSGLPGKKASLIGEALCRKLAGTVLKPECTKVRVIFSNNLLQKKLTIEVIQEIKVPWGEVKKLIEGRDTVTLSARAAAAVTEPDEYIRDIDLAVELIKKFEGRLDMEGVMKSIAGKGPK